MGSIFAFMLGLLESLVTLRSGLSILIESFKDGCSVGIHGRCGISIRHSSGRCGGHTSVGERGRDVVSSFRGGGRCITWIVFSVIVLLFIG